MAKRPIFGAIEGSSQIAGGPVDDRRLGPPQRVGAIFASYQADPAHPFINKPGILAGAEVPVAIDPAWEDIIVYGATPALKAGQQTGTGIRQNLELNRTACFVDNLADLHSHKVAAAQLGAVVPLSGSREHRAHDRSRATSKLRNLVEAHHVKLAGNLSRERA